MTSICREKDGLELGKEETKTETYDEGESEDNIERST